jgi:phage-related protein
VTTEEKRLYWLRGEITSPPFSPAARIAAGYLLGKLQQGELLTMPHSRSMPAVGRRCHELRVADEDTTWRIFYHIDTDDDFIVILDVFAKKSQKTPKARVEEARKRLKRYRSRKREE